MYQLKLVDEEKEILELEKLRVKSFTPDRDIKTISEGTYSKDIEKKDALGFLCRKDKDTVGGMIVGLHGKNLEIERIFVVSDKRGQGAGSFMLNYIMNHQEFFEDYYGTNINCVVLEPIPSSLDFCFKNDFDYSGFQMYKKYAPRKKKQNNTY